MEPKAAALLTPEARLMLRDLAGVLAATEFTPPALDAALRAFAERAGKKLGQVAQPLRAALTGSTASPGIDATLVALGRDGSTGAHCRGDRVRKHLARKPGCAWQPSDAGRKHAEGE